MVFASVTFLFVFLPFFLAGLFIVPGKLRLFYLYIASLLFYFFGEPLCAGLMVLSSLEAFGAGLLMERGRHRKALLAASLVFHFGILAVYKYLGFFCVNLGLPDPGIALPAGISFYTFQNVSYLADVYRKKTPAAKKFLPYGVYIAFFPQLIAGPIENWSHIRVQLENLPRPGLHSLREGCFPLILGMAKKLLLADTIGQCWLYLSSRPEQAGFLGCWFAALCYAFQIYFDFSGYSDMAIGLGRLCGIRLSKNFDLPYSARNVTEFWRRWHMTLSRWFRDYVYIPLGGNRKGRAHTYLNLLITWSLTGFWHGAGWNFLLWGFLWGVALCAEKALPGRLEEKKLFRIGYRIWLWIILLVGWVIFACEDLSSAAAVLREMFSPLHAAGNNCMHYILSFLPLAGCCLLFSLSPGARIKDLFRARPVLAGLAACALLLLCTAALAGQGFHPFLYFRF